MSFKQQLVGVFVHIIVLFRLNLVAIMCANDWIMKHGRFDQLQGCAIECLQKLGQSVPAAYFHPLIRLFKGYVFMT